MFEDYSGLRAPNAHISPPAVYGHSVERRCLIVLANMAMHSACTGSVESIDNAPAVVGAVVQLGSLHGRGLAPLDCSLAKAPALLHSE